MHLQLGEISTIVVSSPEVAKEVMKTKDLVFANRPDFFITGAFKSVSQLISFAPYGAYWKQMRKICITELLSQKSVRTFASIRESEVTDLIKYLHLSSGSPINLTEKCCSVASAITSRVALGKRCEDQDISIKIIKEGSSLMGEFHMSSLFPSLKLLNYFSRVQTKLLDCDKKLNMVMRRIIKEHKETTAITGSGNGESGEEDIVDALLRHQQNEQLECPITIENIQHIIMDLTAGSIGASATAIEWAMSEMVKNPKVMENAQNEVRQAFAGGKIMRGTDIQGLKYLKWVIKETLRLHPPTPLLLPRESRENCEINGYTIPTKTNVIINAWAIGRDPQYWGDDAESFIPERFEHISVDFVGTELQYIPFGAGRRSCPGMSFAIASVEFILAQLLYNFDWKLPDGMVPQDLDMTETFGATAERKNELHLVPIPYHFSQ